MHILLLLLALLPNLAYSDTVRMVTSEWPPFYGKELKKGGVSIEIVRQALKRNGHTLVVDFLPWAKSMNLSLKGDYDALFGAWKNAENEQNYKFSKEHFGRGDGHFIDLMSSSAHELVPENLVGKSIAYVSGYPISDELNTLITQKKITAYQVDTVDQLLKMHQANRIDFILDNISVVKYHYENVFPDADFSLKAVGKDYIDGRLYVAWTKEKELNKVIQDLDNTLLEMKNDGTIIKIESEFHQTSNE